MYYFPPFLCMYFDKLSKIHISPSLCRIPFRLFLATANQMHTSLIKSIFIIFSTLHVFLLITPNCRMCKLRYYCYTPAKSWRGYNFTVVCLCVCLSVCVSGSSCKQNSSQTDQPMWTRFSLNGCLPHLLELY